MKNFFTLLIFVACAAAGYYYWQFSNNKTNMVEFNRNLTAYEQSVTLKREEFQAIVNMLEWQKDNEKKLASLTEIRAKEAKLKASYDQLYEEKSKIITGIRRSNMGRTIPEFILADGRKLTEVKITNVDDQSISISLPSGVMKLAPAELSKEWIQRLHY